MNMKIKDTESLLAYYKGCRPRVFAFMGNEEYKNMAMAYHSLFQQYDPTVIMESAQKYMLEEEKEITPAGLKRNIDDVMKVRRAERSINTPLLESNSAIPMPDDVKERMKAWLK